MAESSTWSRRGERAVGAAADLVGGLGRGFGQVGKRIRRGQYKVFAEGLCAVAGDVASRNGRLKPEEITGFRSFLVENRDNPAIKFFEPDVLAQKFRDYAVKAFLCDDEAFIRVIDEVKQSSKNGKELSDVILIGALSIAFADGECDDFELEAIQDYADRLSVDLPALVGDMGLVLPATGTPLLPPMAPLLPPAGALPPPAAPAPPVTPTLTAGGNVVLASQTEAKVELTWSPAQIGGFDVDVSAFLLRDDGKVRGDGDFVFYNQSRSPDGAVELSRSGDLRTFTLDLSSMPPDIVTVAFAATIGGDALFSAGERLELTIPGTAVFAPDLARSKESALIVGQVSRAKGPWKLRAVGQGFAGGLGPLAAHFGVDVG